MGTPHEIDRQLREELPRGIASWDCELPPRVAVREGTDSAAFESCEYSDASTQCSTSDEEDVNVCDKYEVALESICDDSRTVPQQGANVSAVSKARYSIASDKALADYLYNHLWTLVWAGSFDPRESPLMVKLIKQIKRSRDEDAEDEQMQNNARIGSMCQKSSAGSNSDAPGLRADVRYSACLLSGETVLKLQSSESVFNARLRIAGALDVGVHCIRLANSRGILKADLCMLSQVLGDEDRGIVSVVMTSVTRAEQKIQKAKALIAMGTYREGREMLESIGATLEAKLSLERAFDRCSNSQVALHSSKALELQQELELCDRSLFGMSTDSLNDVVGQGRPS